MDENTSVYMLLVIYGTDVKETGKSVADIFAENKVYLTRTSVDMHDGWFANKKNGLKVIDSKDIETGEDQENKQVKDI